MPILPLPHPPIASPTSIVDGLKTAVKFLKEWQTLIAGVLALGGAWLTVRKISQQIMAQERQYNETKQSKAWAARARLADALSDVISYTKKAAAILIDRSHTNNIFPDDAISEIKDSVEFVEPIAAERLFEILNKYQIQRSRILSYIERRSSRRSLSAEWPDQLYDVAYLHALVTSMFKFARDETLTGPSGEVSFEEMITGLKESVGLVNYVRCEENFTEVILLIERRHKLSKALGCEVN